VNKAAHIEVLKMLIPSKPVSSKLVPSSSHPLVLNPIALLILEGFRIVKRMPPSSKPALICLEY